MNVSILDEYLNQVSVISSFISLRFTRQFSNVGGFEIAVNLNDINVDALKVDRLVYLDPNRCGIIEKVEITRADNSGSEVLVATGLEIKDMINRRITIPPAGYAYETYHAQNTETIVRGLLNNHIISTEDEGRKISIFELGKINNVGVVKDFSTRYKTLGSDVYQLLSEDRLGLSYYVDLNAKKILLEVKAGIDRTIDQDVNPTAIISLRLGTANKNIILHDKQSLKNSIYVGGEGEGTDRIIVTTSSIDEPTGLCKREYFLDSRNTSSEDDLISAGNAKLIELGSVYKVESTTNRNLGIEYDLGDIVTVLDYATSITESLQVTGLIDSYIGASPNQRFAIFGRAPLNMAQAINSRLSSVINMLTQ